MMPNGKFVMKMNAAGVVSKLKQKSHVLLFVSAVSLLVLAVGFAVFLNNENDKRYHELWDHVVTMKEEQFEMEAQLDTAMKKYKMLNTKLRKKREIGENSGESASQPRYKGGAVYIRWGRSSCPNNNTELVYNGVGGGSWYDHPGGATNLQCLPNEPEWGRFTTGTGSAYMYGMEYEEHMTDILSIPDFPQGLKDHNVPCAVCRSKTRTSSLMIPAKMMCVKGWHLEYHGYLMSGALSHKSGTQYICIDERPEADPAGYKDENGALLYIVKAVCGSLPCPKYYNHRELTCVVCTK